MAGPFDLFTGSGMDILGMLKIALFIIIPIIITGVFIYHTVRKKMIFKYPVRIFKTRESGKVREYNTIGGYIGRKNSAPFFRIRIGKVFWIFDTYKDLTTTPDPKYMDEEDRVYYRQLDVDSYIQMSRGFDDKGVIYSPVESDVKYGAILSIQKIKEVLRTESTWKKIAPYVTLVLLAVVFIVAYAMLMDKCSG